MLKMHMFDKAKNKYTKALEALRKLNTKYDNKVIYLSIEKYIYINVDNFDLLGY